MMFPTQHPFIIAGPPAFFQGTGPRHWIEAIPGGAGDGVIFGRVDISIRWPAVILAEDALMPRCRHCDDEQPTSAPLVVGRGCRRGGLLHVQKKRGQPVTSLQSLSTYRP